MSTDLTVGLMPAGDATLVRSHNRDHAADIRLHRIKADNLTVLVIQTLTV